MKTINSLFLSLVIFMCLRASMYTYEMKNLKLAQHTHAHTLSIFFLFLFILLNLLKKFHSLSYVTIIKKNDSFKLKIKISKTKK